jgi:hypothetical protein
MSDFWNNLGKFLFAFLVFKNIQKQRTEIDIALQDGETDLVRPNDALLREINTNNQTIILEREKLEIEKEKLKIEKEKFLFERDKFLVTSLLEDFKARWQELLNFENENNRWLTLYLTAIILSISWILDNSGELGKYKSIAEIFKGDNSYLLLFLAVINTIYTLCESIVEIK